MKHQELTHTIIGAAMEVHKILGNGFQEVIYQRALAIELANNNLEFSREQGSRQISNFIMQDVDIILHHAKLVGVAI